MEIPCETASVLNQKVKEFIGCYGIHVLTCVAYAVSENQSVLVQQIHCMNYFLIYTGTAAEIVCILKSLKTDG